MSASVDDEIGLDVCGFSVRFYDKLLWVDVESDGL